MTSLAIALSVQLEHMWKLLVRMDARSVLEELSARRVRLFAASAKKGSIALGRPNLVLTASVENISATTRVRLASTRMSLRVTSAHQESLATLEPRSAETAELELIVARWQRRVLLARPESTKQVLPGAAAMSAQRDQTAPLTKSLARVVIQESIR